MPKSPASSKKPKRRATPKGGVRSRDKKTVSERTIQDWFQAIVKSGRLHEKIEGRHELLAALTDSESPTWLPDFPIDYLCRIRVLQAAASVLDELTALEVISTSARSISRTMYESLYVDLLYCARERSHFVIVEIKREKATARETITELLAYEHEIFNHLPFAGHRDVQMVIVSTEFSTLLDHAVTGLITWTRRRVLCLRVNGNGKSRKLTIHLPRAWGPIRQEALPATGIQTAHLSFFPIATLTKEQAFAVCETAATLMAREAERAGGSGFVMVAEDHFFPDVSDRPFAIIAGAVNPFAFLPTAERMGFARSNASALSHYLLRDGNREELPISWSWLSSDGNAAMRYLRQYGTATWEGLSHWDTFRDSARWRHDSITPDRHIKPLLMDFWGILGDYACDLVVHWERMQNFMPGYCKPGMDWRQPHLGVMLLDEIAVAPIVEIGQWTFPALFEFGLRLGRFAAVAATFADADVATRRKLQAALFWAEADLLKLMNEVTWRYIAAAEITESPPVLTLGNYDDSEAVMKRVGSFAAWFAQRFIGPDSPLLQQAFVTGLNCYALYDAQFTASRPEAEFQKIRHLAATAARNWLHLTATAVYSNMVAERDRGRLFAAVKDSFGTTLSFESSPALVRTTINALDERTLIDKLFHAIPAIVGKWHPQLAHTLARMATNQRDWTWLEEQVRERRRRGVKYPCVYLSAGGQVGIAQFPDELGFPTLDPETEVLYASNETAIEVVVVAKWEDLRAGRVPGVSSDPSSKAVPPVQNQLQTD